MKDLCLKTELMGYTIEARCSVLDVGIHVLLIGGCRTHVGAVSYAFPGQQVQTIQFPTHREGIVSECWAKRLCQQFQTPVVVNCGIHYDNVTRDDIQEIVNATQVLLNQAEAELTL